MGMHIHLSIDLSERVTIVSSASTTKVNNNVIAVAVEQDNIMANGNLYVGFDYQLTRGKDFHVFASTANEQIAEHSDDDVLASMLKQLFTRRSGVDTVKVRAFRLIVHCSMAVTAEPLMERIYYGITESGYACNKLSPRKF
jgi:hypothetical protein